MIDITCPSCNITYHADETHIGKGFRCKVCGRIIRVETSLLHSVVEITAKKQKSDHDWQVWGIGIIVAVLLAAIPLAVWLQSPSVDAPHHVDVPELKMAPPVERIEMPKEEPLRPIILRTKKTSASEPEPLQPLVVIPACAQGQQPVRLATGERIEPDEGTDGAEP